MADDRDEPSLRRRRATAPEEACTVVRRRLDDWGVTLVELLVAVLMIAVLAALALPLLLGG